MKAIRIDQSRLRIIVILAAIGAAQANHAAQAAKLADEGESFTLTSDQTVAYGRHGAWVDRALTAGRHACSNEAFGTDPAVGVRKICRTTSSDGSTPTPPPPPTPDRPAGDTATLTWLPSTTAGVAGYRVYYGTASHSYAQAAGSGLSAGNGSTYTVNGLQGQTLYYFAVTAVDSAGNESALSNEVSKMTP